LPDAIASALRGSKGEVLYGFRPEQTTIAESGQGLSMPVSFVERIGARTIVHFGDGETSVKAVFDNDVGLRIGETAIVAPNPASVRVFDASSGRAIEARL
jgi:multiple sugar transport system ATP-binding protein